MKIKHDVRLENYIKQKREIKIILSSFIFIGLASIRHLSLMNSRKKKTKLYGLLINNFGNHNIISFVNVYIFILMQQYIFSYTQFSIILCIYIKAKKKR